MLPTLALVAALLASSPPVPTEEAPPPGPERPAPNVLRDHLALDLAYTAAAYALWGATEFVFKDPLAVPACRWCDRDRLNPADDAVTSALSWRGSRSVAATLSDVIAFGIGPLALAAVELGFGVGAGDLELAALDGLYVLQAVSVALLLTQATKFIAARERPFVRVRTPEDRLEHAENDDNLSFISGHTSLTVGLVTALATVAELRGYEQAWWVWAVGVPLAVGVPYLRIAAEKHYFTDVLAGAAVGALAGTLLPRLLHPRALAGSPARTLRVVPAGRGLALVAVF